MTELADERPVLPVTTDTPENRGIPQNEAVQSNTKMPELASQLIEAKNPDVALRQLAEVGTEKEDIWNLVTANRHLKDLGTTSEINDDEIGGIKSCYEGKNRFYHAEPHAREMAQTPIPQELQDKLSYFTPEQAKALIFWAGLGHDMGYMHVDANDITGEGAWPSALTGFIDKKAKYEPVEKDGKRFFKTTLTNEGLADSTTQMVAGIFAYNHELGKLHNEGGNEFVSNIGIAKLLEAKGIKPEMIVAITAMTAATIAFKPSLHMNGDGTINDGYMGELANRVKEAKIKIGEETHQLNWDQVNEVMMLATHFANSDVSPFLIPDNASVVVEGGRKVKKEEIPVLRQGVKDINGLVSAATLLRGSPLLYDWIGSPQGAKVPVPAENVPHIYFMRNENGDIKAEESYPPRSQYEKMVENARENGNLARVFFEAHELGILLTASFAGAIGEPNAPIPGFVDADEWKTDTKPVGEKFDTLSHRDNLVYDVLMNGKNQQKIDDATPRQSPIGGKLLGSLGSEGIKRLSERVKEIRSETKSENPFSDKERGIAFIREVKSMIGEENMKTIKDYFVRVAEKYKSNPEFGNETRVQSLSELEI